MIPILFPPTATDFSTRGLGPLSDCISCTVTEQRNGIYELEMQYPLTGLHYADIADRSIILAIPSPYRAAQPFRVYQITRNMSGTATIYAQHISYDLAGVPVEPFSQDSLTMALTWLSTHSAIDNPFSFSADFSSSADFGFSVPTACRSLLGGVDGSILDVYGGEYEFDGYDVILHRQRGGDNGVTIRYGKNLTDLSQDSSTADLITGIYPYWQDSETGALMTCSPAVVSAPGTYDFQQVIPVDFTSDFEGQPTPEQLRDRAERYISDNSIGVPTVSTTVSFVQLEQMSGYEDLALLERCDLCDTVTVKYPALGVSAKAKIVTVVTDVLLERYNSMEIGSVRANVAQTIGDQQAAIDSQQQEVDKINETFPSRWQQSMYELAQKITGQTDSHVMFHPMEYPSVIIIAENTDLTAAGNSALYLSSAGLAGTDDLAAALQNPGLFRTAITIDGHIIGDRITGLTIQGEQIIGGIIQSPDGKVYIDLQTGEAYVPRLIGTVGNNVHFGVEQGTFNIDGANYSGMRFYRLQNVAPPFEDIKGDYFEILKTASGTWLRAISDSGKDVILELVGGDGIAGGRVFSVMGGAGLNRQFAVYETGRVDIARELWVGQWASGGTTGARIESGGNVVSRGGFYAQNTDDGNRAYMLPDGTVHGVNISGFTGTFTGTVSSETVSGTTGSFSSSVSGGMLCLSTDSRASLRRLNATSTYSDYGLTFPDGSKFFICRMSGTGLATPCLQVDQSGITLASTLNTNGYSIIYPHTGTFAVGGYDENGTLQNMIIVNGASSTADGRMANFYTHANFNNYTIYNTHIGTLSDRRYKKYVAKSQESALDIVDRMGMYRYTYKKAAGEGLAEKKVRFGQMADELQEVYPEAVIQDSASGTLYIDKMELVDLLLKSVQELSEKVKSLETKISERKETVNANRG